jgi:hypothetical protein
MERKYRSTYKQEDIAAALHAVRSGAMSRHKAASAFSIPRSTLRDKLDGRSGEKVEMGRKTVLTAAEEYKLQVTI